MQKKYILYLILLCPNVLLRSELLLEDVNGQTQASGCVVANNSTLCCFVNGSGACLPQVIVAGTQKSGSTVLAGAAMSPTGLPSY